MDLSTCTPAQFLETLERSHFEDRRRHVLSLGEEKTERSIRILCEVLQGDSWYLRDLAVISLARIGEPAVTMLRPLVYAGLWYTRASAARALGLMEHRESLPDLVNLLYDSNHTVRENCLASIADLVRAGEARETARLFWNQGARRADELKRLLLAVHPEAGTRVAELLADPDSFLHEDAAPPAEEERETEVGGEEPRRARRNA